MNSEIPPHIAANIAHFTGRTWLLPTLLTWLEHTTDRMFILTGEPGTGKSSVMAWLAGVGPSPIETIIRLQLERIRDQVKASHFCMATSGNITPKALAEMIAAQLTRNVPEFASALEASLADQVKISVEQHIDTMQGGSVTGVSIEQLNLDKLDDELAFNRILRDPLKKLYQKGYNEPILLLVDALDEAAIYIGTPNIIQLLARLDDLPIPIRILATTRTDPRVLKFYRGVQTLDLINDAPAEVDDVHLYARERLAVLEDSQRGSGWARQIALAAEGNFLYAHLVLTDLLSRLPDLPGPEILSLPKGLSGLYHAYLNRELGADEDRWYETFKPILGLIAVAQGEGLSLAQIKRITGLKEKAEPALRACAQYIHGDLPEGPFRPFHKSFADFLLEDQENRHYHIDAVDMHQWIAAHYLNTCRDNWQACDRYGLRYLIPHLIASQQLDAVYQLIESQAWTAAKFVDTPWADSLVQDLQLASASAAHGNVKDWVCAMGYQLRRALIEQLMSTVSTRAILLMAKLGQIERALEFAQRHTWRRFDLIRDIARIVAPTQPAEAVHILVNELAHLGDGASILNRCKVKLATAEEILRLTPSFSREAQILIEEVRELEPIIPESDRTTYRIEWALPVLALSSQPEAAIKAATDLPPFQQAQAMRHISIALPDEGRLTKQRLAKSALNVLEGLDQSPELIQEKMRAIVTLLPLVDSHEQAALLASLEADGNYLQSIEAPNSYDRTQDWVIDRMAKINPDWAKHMLLESEWRGAEHNDGHDVIVEIAKVNYKEALQLFERFAVWVGSSQTLADIISVVALDDTIKAEALISEYAERLGRDVQEVHLALAEGYLAQGDNQKAQSILEAQIFPVEKLEGLVHARSDLKLAILEQASDFVSVGDAHAHLMEFPVCPRCRDSKEQEAKTILARMAARQNRIDFLDTYPLTEQAQVVAAYELAEYVGPETARMYLERHHIPEWSNHGKEVHVYIAQVEAQQDPTKIEVLLEHFKGDKGPHHFCDHMTALPFALQKLVETKKIEPDEARKIIEQLYALLIDWQCPKGDTPPRRSLIAGRCFCYSRRDEVLVQLIGTMAQLVPDRAEEMVDSLPNQPIKIRALSQILYQTQPDQALVHRIIEASQECIKDPWQRAEAFYQLATSLPTQMSDIVSYLIQLAEPLFKTGSRQPELQICKAQALMGQVSDINQFDYVVQSLNTIESLIQLRDKLRVLDILAQQASRWSGEDQLSLLWRIWELSTGKELVDVQAFISFSVPLVKSIGDEAAFWHLHKCVEWAYGGLPQVNQN